MKLSEKGTDTAKTSKLAQKVYLADQKNQRKIRSLRGKLKWEGKLDEMRRA